MSDAQTSHPDTRALQALADKVEAATSKDWRLDEAVIEALGGRIQVVGRLGLNGRSRGSERMFWPHTPPFGPGLPLASATKDEASRRRYAKKIRALIAGGRDAQP